MHADLILYSQPNRPLINPLFDLFALLNVEDDAEFAIGVPAKVIAHIDVVLPKKIAVDELNDDSWEFIVWQTEEKGYTIVRSLGTQWLYWSPLCGCTSTISFKL